MYLYLPSKKMPDGSRKILSQYYVAEFAHPITGKRQRYFTKLKTKVEAERKAWKEHERLSLGGAGLVQRGSTPQAITVNTMIDHLQSRYENDDKWSHQNRSLFKAVREAWGNRDAASITTAEIEGYVKLLKDKKYSEGTIYHRLQVLTQAYEHCREIKVSTIPAPAIPRLPNKDSNRRRGFFTREEIELVIEHLPEHMKDMTRLAFFIGWRSGSLRKLEWTEVDLTPGEERLTLPVVKNKTREEQVVVLRGELLNIIKRRQAKRKYTNASGATVLSSYVFHRGDGRMIGDYRWVWNEACSRAGFGKMICAKCKEESSTHIWCSTCHQRRDYKGRYFHDLRRSSVKALIRAGIPRKVAMSITGHKTESVFERYHIVETEDQAQAVNAIAAPWTPKLKRMLAKEND